jgi:hypothetical protein
VLDPKNMDWKLNAISTELFLAGYDVNPVPRLEIIVAQLRKLNDEGKLSPVRANQFVAIEGFLTRLKSQHQDITSTTSNQKR